MVITGSFEGMLGVSKCCENGLALASYWVLCREWMEGPMKNVDPDQCDQDVGNIWRNLYKLEKGFEAVPLAKKIANKVHKWC